MGLGAHGEQTVLGKLARSMLLKNSNWLRPHRESLHSSFDPVSRWFDSNPFSGTVEQW
jgi:hypothetical protein